VDTVWILCLWSDHLRFLEMGWKGFILRLMDVVWRENCVRVLSLGMWNMLWSNGRVEYRCNMNTM
jgi:hypothetical protein